MASGDTPYTPRHAAPDYIVRESQQIVALEIVLDATAVEPTSGTFELLAPDGSSVASGATVQSSSVATYTIAALSLPSTLSLGGGYREIWALSFDGTPHTFHRDARIVLSSPRPVVADADLLAVYTDLSRHLQSGVSTFRGYRDEAWRRILGRLEAQGVFPEHIVTDWSLREVHLELALHLACLDFSQAQPSRWADLAAHHKKEFEIAWGRLRFRKATSSLAEDGTGQQPAKGVTYMNASPRRSWRGFGGL